VAACVKCSLLVFLWLGVVATMLGLLVELVLLPLRLPANQSALIFVYQDWTMGVLGLKLWHLLVVVAPRREGQGQEVAGAAAAGARPQQRPAAGGAAAAGAAARGGAGGAAGAAADADDDSWLAHFEALQREGFRHINCRRALTKLVLPVMAHLGTALAAPYVVTRWLLPMVGLPARWLQLANLWAYTVLAVAMAAVAAVRKVRALAAALHATIKDDRYLVGRRLNNCEQQAAREKAAAEAARSAQQVEGGQVGSKVGDDEAGALSSSKGESSGVQAGGEEGVSSAHVDVEGQQQGQQQRQHPHEQTEIEPLEA
jgi:E3 ubiquitin-protein ligase MARCH6